MLIASLKKFVTSTGDVAYCATDPFDGEMLTAWHDTIMQVDNELEELPGHWGLLLACHRGESDVPTVIGDAPPSDTTGHTGSTDTNTLPCS